MPKKKTKIEEVTVSYTSTPDEIVLDSRLGRRYEHDPMKDMFPMRAMLPRIAYKKPKSKIWECKTVLDQGAEGSCVGHAFAHDLIARPYPLYGVKRPDAVKIYKKAQELDEWPGDNYSGTSVLAGAKACMELYAGSFESYRWGVTLEDVVATLGHHGPVICGINWYSGFYNTDKDGVIKLSGSIAGGHAILAIGVDTVKKRIQLLNSWGPQWGQNGRAWISYGDFERLMNESGDCCVPINRKYWK